MIPYVVRVGSRFLCNRVLQVGFLVTIFSHTCTIAGAEGAIILRHIQRNRPQTQPCVRLQNYSHT
jgi:hypothetical protein